MPQNSVKKETVREDQCGHSKQLRGTDEVKEADEVHPEPGGLWEEVWRLCEIVRIHCSVICRERHNWMDIYKNVILGLQWLHIVDKLANLEPHFSEFPSIYGSGLGLARREIHKTLICLAILI